MNRLPHTPRVAILVNPAYKGSRSLLRGIISYAHEHGPWRFLVSDGPIDDPRYDFDAIRPDGAIITSTQIVGTTPFRRKGIPCVLTDSVSKEELKRYKVTDIPVVRKDSHAIGKLAADYFLERRYANFAFVPDPLVRPWSVERCEGFRQTLRLAGYDCLAYRQPRSRARLLWHQERSLLVDFLQALPKPAAVFAANDDRARQVLDACIEAGIQVPKHVSVLGVDNDECICETCHPTLSSIRTNSERRGYEAARILDALMAGEDAGVRTVQQEPEAIVERNSTAYGVLQNAFVSRAYFFIQAEALKRDVKVDDVIRAMNCSRRYAEKLFREQMGVSIKDEIDRVRFNLVKELLRTTDLSVAEIAERFNFTSEASLYNQFRRKFKISLSQFRQRS